jgi:hypothetical protein
LRPMPVEFLTDDEAAAYGQYTGAPSQADLERVFFHDDEDRALVDLRRGDHMKAGFALQVVTMRSLGTFLEDPLDVPAAVLGEREKPSFPLLRYPQSPARMSEVLCIAATAAGWL